MHEMPMPQYWDEVLQPYDLKKRKEIKASALMNAMYNTWLGFQEYLRNNALPEEVLVASGYNRTHCLLFKLPVELLATIDDFLNDKCRHDIKSKVSFRFASRGLFVSLPNTWVFTAGPTDCNFMYQEVLKPMSYTWGLYKKEKAGFYVMRGNDKVPQLYCRPCNALLDETAFELDSRVLEPWQRSCAHLQVARNVDASYLQLQILFELGDWSLPDKRCLASFGKYPPITSTESQTHWRRNTDGDTDMYFTATSKPDIEELDLTFPLKLGADVDCGTKYFDFYCLANKILSRYIGVKVCDHAGAFLNVDKLMRMMDWDMMETVDGFRREKRTDLASASTIWTHSCQDDKHQIGYDVELELSHCGLHNNKPVGHSVYIMADVKMLQRVSLPKAQWDWLNVRKRIGWADFEVLCPPEDKFYAAVDTI